MRPESRPFAEPAWIARYRFIYEIAEWIAIYFAWGWIPLLLAIAALTLVGTPDTHGAALIRVRGRVRLLIEAATAALGIVAAWSAWGAAAGVLYLLAAILLYVESRPRLTWLWHH